LGKAKERKVAYETIAREKQGYGGGMARSEDYRRHALEVMEHPFCVAMLMKVLQCSRKYLYYKPISPEFLGGKFCKNLPRPVKVPTIPSLRVVVPKLLEPIEDLIHEGCCEADCWNRMELTVLKRHRQEYKTGNQVRGQLEGESGKPCSLNLFSDGGGGGVGMG